MSANHHDTRVLLFTGEGKGKTTAALGMALRAAGHSLTTLIVSFIKADERTGEYAVCKALAGVEMRQVGLGFVPRNDDSPRLADHRQAAEAGLRAVAVDLASGRFRVVILDEICTAVARGLLTEDAVVAAIHQAAKGSIIVMTGRGASPGLIALADTATEMRCLKHGYESGRVAQPGVEY